MRSLVHKAHKGKVVGYGPRLIGYARVSTDEQDLRMQTEALLRAGVHKDNIWTDKKSGKNLDRRGLDAALLDARSGDVLVVWRFDRLSRSLRDLLDLFERLSRDGIQLRSLHEQLDTTTPMGKLMFQMAGMLAEFERNLISMRTQAGMATSKARGTRFGPRRKMDKAKVAEAVKLLKQRKGTVEVARKLGVSVVTLRKEVLEFTNGKKLWSDGPHAKR